MFPPQAEPIGEASIGRVVMVRGAVVARDLMDSPLTGEPCVYYRYSIEQWRQSRVAGVGGDGFWELGARDEAIVEFYVDDGSGRAIVAPARARIRLGRRMPAEILELDLQRRAHHLILRPGDKIEVTGQTSRVNDLFDEGRGYRSTPRRLMLSAPDKGFVDIRLLSGK